MINKNEVVDLVSVTKNCVTDTTWNDVTKKLNTSADFDANGLGYSAANTSTIVAILVGSFDDQRITATMKFVAPTTAGSEEIGVMLRVISLDSPDTTYYYARVVGGQARITKVIDTVFTNLASGAFALPQNTNVTITFSVVGSQLSASFVASGVSTVNLSATDTDITGRGIAAIRSLTSTFRCSTFTVEQL